MQSEDNGEHADDTVSLGLASEIKMKAKEAKHALAHESKETKDMADEITNDYQKNHLLVQTGARMNFDEATLLQGKG